MGTSEMNTQATRHRFRTYKGRTYMLSYKFKWILYNNEKMEWDKKFKSEKELKSYLDKLK